MKQVLRGLLATLVLAIPLALFAQEFRGTISGQITDPTGGMIAGAKITVTETQTGTKVPTVSGASGEYTAAFLLPGDYDIDVQMQGFKAFARHGVHVGAGDHAVIDVRLEVGDVATTLEVTSDASLLNTENSSLGQAITTKEVAELPINGRTPIMAAALSLGVIGYAQPGLVHPFDAQAAAGSGLYLQVADLAQPSGVSRQQQCAQFARTAFPQQRNDHRDSSMNRQPGQSGGAGGLQRKKSGPPMPGRRRQPGRGFGTGPVSNEQARTGPPSR